MTAVITPKSFKYVISKLEDLSTALETELTISSSIEVGDTEESCCGLTISLPLSSGRISVVLEDAEKGEIAYYDYDEELVGSFVLEYEGNFTRNFDATFRAALLKSKENN
jgi:hypothetical protein